MVAVDIISDEKTDFQLYTTIAFLVGGLTSMLCGYLGMMVATYSNTKVAHLARNSLDDAFKLAYRAGCAIGFGLTGLSLLMHAILIVIYVNMNIAPSVTSEKAYVRLYHAISGYGLGGSAVALFARVGGGIYTKAADVGADLVGKYENDLPEDSPKNPATIADNVGDNVGDIAGMGADLFGSLAESTCAALVVGAELFSEFNNGANILYPLIISSFGILGSLLTSFFATDIMKVTQSY